MPGVPPVLNELEVRQVRDAIIKIDQTLSRIAQSLPGMATAARSVASELEGAAEAAEEASDAMDQMVDLKVGLIDRLKLKLRQAKQEAQEGETMLGKLYEVGVSRGKRLVNDTLNQSGTIGSFRQYGLFGLLLHGLKGLAGAEVEANRLAQKFERVASVGKAQINQVNDIIKMSKESGLDAAAGLAAFAEAGATLPESLSTFRSGLLGIEMGVSHYAARLDEVFELQAGSSAKLAATIAKNLGGTLPESMAALEQLGLAARATGTDINSLMASIEAGVGSMRLGMQAADGLAAGYTRAASAVLGIYGNNARGRDLAQTIGGDVVKGGQPTNVYMQSLLGKGLRDRLLQRDDLSEGARKTLTGLKEGFELAQFSKSPALYPGLEELGGKMGEKDAYLEKFRIARQIAQSKARGFAGQNKIMEMLLAGSNVSPETIALMNGPQGDAILNGQDTTSPAAMGFQKDLEEARRSANDKRDSFEKLQEILEKVLGLLLKQILQGIMGLIAVTAAPIGEKMSVMGAISDQFKINFNEGRRAFGDLGMVGTQIFDAVGKNLFTPEGRAELEKQRKRSDEDTDAYLSMPWNKRDNPGASPSQSVVTGTKETQTTVVDASGRANTVSMTEEVVLVPVSRSWLDMARGAPMSQAVPMSTPR